MSDIGGKGRKATVAPAADSQKESSKRCRLAGATVTVTQGASQPTIDEAAEDAQAEQEMLNYISPSNSLLTADVRLLVLVH